MCYATERLISSIFCSTPQKLIDQMCIYLSVLTFITQDPRGSRMVQWKGLQSVCCGKLLAIVLLCSAIVLLLRSVELSPKGLVNMSFPLSDQPVFGEWFIFVEVQGHTYNRSFEVQKYGEVLNVTLTSLEFHVYVAAVSNMFVRFVTYIYRNAF